MLGVDSYRQNRKEKDTAFCHANLYCAIRSARIATKLEARKELQVIMGTWKLIVGYLNGPWNKPYGPIQTPNEFQNIL